MTRKTLTQIIQSRRSQCDICGAAGVECGGPDGDIVDDAGTWRGVTPTPGGEKILCACYCGRLVCDCCAGRCCRDEG